MRLLDDVAHARPPLDAALGDRLRHPRLHELRLAGDDLLGGFDPRVVGANTDGVGSVLPMHFARSSGVRRRPRRSETS